MPAALFRLRPDGPSKPGTGLLAVAALIAVAIAALPAPAADDGDRPAPWSFSPLPDAEALPPAPGLDAAAPGEWAAGHRIDAHLHAAMREQGLAPAAPAEDRVVLRRLHFSLVGLPPDSDDLAAYEQDVGERGRAAALAEVIEGLLASPRYGERWGRHWLDLVRYADKLSSWETTDGSPWLYRDWVVAALNDDMPYDEFVLRQFAADLLPGAAPEDNAALGLLGLGPTYWKELQLPPDIISGTVAEEWEERVEAVGRAVLGLTVSCARCHDHLEDPVSMADYYALAGVFASVRQVDLPILPEPLWAPVAAAKEEVAGLRQEIADLRRAKPEDLAERVAALEARIAEIESGTPLYETPMAKGIEDAALRVLLADPDKDQSGTKLDYLPGEAQDLPLHLRGDPNAPGDPIPRRFLAAFPGPDGAPRPLDEGSGRLPLARALVEEGAPLSARVIVNRVWRWHFGRGIVETPSDFGNSGEPPSHPELLDDLASRFVASGWSLKWLHREILSSAAWQQGSVAPESEAKDPDNRWFARHPRRRLEVEAWRDALLAATGELDLEMGGPPLELSSPENARRTLYGEVQRRELDPLLRLNDFPDPVAHSETRPATTSPLQQLFTLNSPFMRARAEAFAARLARETASAPLPARVAAAYRLLYQRPPTESELALASAYLEGREADKDAWTAYAQALLGSNEFLYLD